MSVHAITWAFAQPVEHSSAKFVLVALANCADGKSFECYPSIAYLCDATAQNRKTVLENIKRLVGLGYICDTGKRKGRTGQIKSYRLNHMGRKDDEPTGANSPENGTAKASRKRNSTENGTVPKTDGKSPENGSETVPKTGHGTVSEPSVNLQIDAHPFGCAAPPDVNLIEDAQDQASLLPELQQRSAATGRSKKDADAALQTACRETWDAYSGAYAHRYGVPPIRNAKVNAQVKQFVQRLGLDESPLVAAWFLSHVGSYYAQKGHSFGFLLADAEKLRTEWATGRCIATSAQERRGATMAALTGYSHTPGRITGGDVLEGRAREIKDIFRGCE